ncbi:MAG: 23S rRNA (pseudouridine(1915)-N(3))-methyltransferase RlmH [Gemmatimonadota bacterium]|nr:23S rRNA (pseudouridine(1915)-N(3))-methyltransferase RlmH [Gemmatimonadota bacterium]
MNVRIVLVGRVRGVLASPVREFEARAGRYWKLDVVEVDEGVKGGRADPDRVRETEGERILARLPEGADVVALTREGKGMTSSGLSRYLRRLALDARPGVAFVIGGAFGLSPAVLSRASRRLSLSPMTLPHDMARLLLAEQLYRAGTIARGEPYHKG